MLRLAALVGSLAATVALAVGAPAATAALAVGAPVRVINPQAHTVALVALGCPKNTVDAEVMLGDLQRNGLRVVSEPREADVVIVNTCAFVEDARRESIAAVVEAAQLKDDRDVPTRGLYVTGCMAQRYAEELAVELPEVDAVVGFEHYRDLPEQVLRLLADADAGADVRPQAVLVGGNSVPFRNEEDRVQLTAPHTAYVRVAEGCDHACTFCAIPGFRGSFRSKPFDVVVAEVTRMVANGCREINLIAEDTNQFGSDWGTADPRRLSDLLAEISEIEGLRWVRLLYCYPSYFSAELVEAIATLPKVVKYIDIPLQHLSSPTLKRMQRPPQGSTVALLRRLRAAVPALTLRTTFISGFPGETDEEHDELVALARELRFERGGAFSYSAEEGTPAADYADQVDEAVKEARRDELVALFQETARAHARSLVGQKVRVMVDRMEGLDAICRTESDAPEIDNFLRIPECPLKPGTELEVTVVAADDMDLVGVVA